MNFCQIHKKYLWTSDNMSIENRQNICYNEITKEVKSNEKLNFRISIFWLWWKGRKSERKNLQGKFSEKMFFDFMSKPNVKKERNKNDVRYQDRTEITLGCVGKHDQGLFHFYGICLRRGWAAYFLPVHSHFLRSLALCHIIVNI